MIASIALAALAASGASAAVLSPRDYPGSPSNLYINYTSVTGYFLQDNPATNASTFNYTLNNFGLINRTYPATENLSNAADLTQWQKFELQVDALNRDAPRNVVYKVLFMGRHGEGYHNAAETFYGTPAWNCYWAELVGNSTTRWEDAHLTANGVLQAQIANRFWQHEIDVQKIPTPQSFYTSPLSRCLATANITFSGLTLPRRSPFIPTVKEFLREGISLHTCDHRSNKTYIANTYPSYKFERNFNEYDELWNGVTAESDSSHQKRQLALLDDIFTSDDSTWISFTSHSGTIASTLQVLGHRTFSLSTGAVIPVLVEAKYLPASDAPATSVGPFTTSTWCHNAPPITSSSGVAQGCVCSPTTGPLPSLSTQSPFIANQTAPINEFTTTTTVAGASASSSAPGYPHPTWGHSKSTGRWWPGPTAW